MGQITCGFLINDFAPFVHSWDMTWHTYGRYLLVGRHLKNFNPLALTYASSYYASVQSSTT